MRQLKVGVIGVGQMGAKHAEVYARLPQAELVGLADPRIDACRQVAGRLGVEDAYEDYQELLARADLEAVSICTPDEAHKEPVLAAIDAGKHIMLEKPLATELKEAEEIVSALDQSSVKAMVAYLLRFDPRYLAVKEAIERGDLGEIVYIVSHRNSPHTEGPKRYKAGTSLTMHVAVHDLDLITWFMQTQPSKVFAIAVSKLLEVKQMTDAASALITFENGVLASVNYSWVLPDHSTTRLDARMEVVGTHGSAYVGVYHEQAVLLTSARGIDAPDVHHAPGFGGEVRGDLREELIAFIDCVLHDRPSPIPVEEGLHSLKLANAIEESISKGIAVYTRSPK
jgi:predicted dehydrogenase